MSTSPLSRFRILEIGGGDAIAYCGKLFADFGAEVIKCEPNGGDPRRAEGAQIDTGQGQTSAFQAWLNTNKLCITADPATDDGAAVIRELLPSCDLLLDGRAPKVIDQSSLQHKDLQDADPGLTIVGLSWFGNQGPYRDFEGTDAVVRSLAGVVYEAGPAEGPPMLATEGQAAAIGAMTAFLPAAATLWDAKSGGRRFTSSIHAAISHISEYDIGLQLDLGKRGRVGVNVFGRTYPAGPYATAKGWLGVTIMSPAQWVSFCHMLELPDLGADPMYDTAPKRQEHAEELDKILRPLLLTRPAAEWFEMGIKNKVPLAILPGVDEIQDLQFHKERQSFGTVSIGDARFDAPILPNQLTGTPPIRDGVAEMPGQTDRSTLPDHTRTAPAKVAEGLPLRDLNILDLSMGWAGPLAVRQLADLGANVIKVEACEHQDWFRGIDTRGPYYELKYYERHLGWQFMNRNKHGITLDISSPKGREIVFELAKTADVVIDSYAADIMPKYGLDAEKFLAVNPQLIVLTMPAFGMKTSWHYGRAYGSTLEHASGMPSVNGRPEDPPAMSHAVMGDPIGGMTAACSILQALLARQVTGTGQHIDIAQAQCLIPLFVESIIDYSVTGKVPPRLGNRHPRYAPHGCYRLMGDDSWLTIAVRTDAEWAALCSVIHRPDLAADPALATVDGRRTHADLIDAAIGEWALLTRAFSGLTDLQEAGIPAGVVRQPLELGNDPHMIATGRYQIMTRPYIGAHMQPRPAYVEGDATQGYDNRIPAPTIGQHNREVLQGKLGLDDAQFDALLTEGIIGFEARPKAAKKAG
ncbi:CoA transferase [Pseudooceanicola sp. MF1-13]|uniref:CaiB/BaiF CoA-transferase family protein n=1 Tax=Pseudooceanicola sp. MF1-13 TaxID=3379095 RepID=UPI003892C736